jgi:hypothetical protein
MSTQTWRTDEPCPVCGHGLYLTEIPDDTQAEWECRSCGWSASWQAATDLDHGPVGLGPQISALPSPRRGPEGHNSGQPRAGAA